jgi:hypothetical protein
MRKQSLRSIGNLTRPCINNGMVIWVTPHPKFSLWVVQTHCCRSGLCSVDNPLTAVWLTKHFLIKIREFSSYSPQFTGREAVASRGYAIWLSTFSVTSILKAVWWTPRNVSWITTQLGCFAAVLMWWSVKGSRPNIAPYLQKEWSSFFCLRVCIRY